MRSLFGVLSRDAESSKIVDWINHVVRERAIDLSDYESQQATKPTIYPTPTSSSDLIGTEKAGDIATATGFLYVVVDNSGVLEWRRVAISTF
jgi:hypothetical protein